MTRRWLLFAATAAVILAVGFGVGLSTGSGSSNAAGSTGTETTAPTSTALPPSAQTVTQPQVTLLPPVTTADTAQLPGNDRPTINLGDMNTDEQFVLGALYSDALQAAGFNVNISHNVGPNPVPQNGLKQGSLDIYPQYLNRWDRQVAGIGKQFPTEAAAYSAGTAYANSHGFELLAPTPGSDTTGFAVTTQFARENGLHSLAQLDRQPLLTFGLPIGFKGFWQVEQAYEFKAGIEQPGYSGEQYPQLAAGSVQVAYVNTTDPRLSEPEFTLLANPKHVYGYGNIVPVTTPAVVKAEGPAFVAIINRVDSLLTTRVLRGLNAEIELEGHQPGTVAQQFLQGNGILPLAQLSVTP